jgi:leucyl-tRNA synthetase
MKVEIPNYNHSSCEKKWQKIWQENDSFKFDESSSKPKYYVLEMLPYPSGKIHMGHLRNYAIGDALARFKKAQGFNVLHPMGFDAFGLPAENAALEHKVHPQNWTLANIENMRGELKSIGLSYDWSREVITCLPNYYKHEQKIFIDFVKAGLAYQKESFVNWDPIDNTVLANEQVVDGRGWRSGALVEKKKLKQWFLKVSDFSEELLAELKNLGGWDERVLSMQEKWIGKSEGAIVEFKICNYSKIINKLNKINDDLKGLNARFVEGDRDLAVKINGSLNEISSKLSKINSPNESEDEVIKIYTTRPDTLFGASFVAISAQHPLAVELSKHSVEIANFISECEKSAVNEQALETAEKKGINTGLQVINPLDNSQKLDVYVANFVVMEYGTGAIFGCPAHDERDFCPINVGQKRHCIVKSQIRRNVYAA